MARRRKQFRITRRGVLVAAILLAAAGILVPTIWYDQVGSTLQILAPFQSAVDSAADGVAGVFDDDTTLSPIEAEELNRKYEAAMHRVASLSARVALLEDDVNTLVGTRTWNAGGWSLADTGRLLPADVVLSRDLLPWRTSTLIDVGTSEGLFHGAPVASNELSVHMRAQDEEVTGLAILHAEILVGFVRNVRTRTATVQLLSDVTTHMNVINARIDDDSVRLSEGYHVLNGRGDGLMELVDVPVELVKEGRIAEGDLILSDPTDPRLPAAMVIGYVRSITPVPQNPLLTTITVAPGVNVDTLRKVYVYVPEYR